MMAKKEFRGLANSYLLSLIRNKPISWAYTIYYYDKNETQQEREKLAIDFGIKEFSNIIESRPFLRSCQLSYGKDWEIKIIDAKEYNHYEDLQHISLEEFLGIEE